MTRRVVILGSTGSIGTQTLEVIEHLRALHDRDEFPLRLEVAGLAARNNHARLLEQGARFPGARLALAGESAPSLPGVLAGPDAAERLVRDVECDLVVAAIVGIAGLPATLAAVELGRDVALANKETLVAAGSLVIDAIESHARAGRRRPALLPIDSEHSGVWQALMGVERERATPPPTRVGPNVRRVVLTASGGPMLAWTRDAIRAATPRDALHHPTWSMGAKVTIDSASLMNKSLELIEASWLFGLEPDRLGMVVHPQSIVHCFVETADGSTLAQLGRPDMRTPIQVALAFPHLAPGLARSADLASLAGLEFSPVDTTRFPAAEFWRAALGEHAGTTAGAILNAANEQAVLDFLASDARLPFGLITDLVGEALASLRPRPARTLADVLDADHAAREFVRHHLPHPAPAAPHAT